jgi:replicative DNA helicase
MTNQTEDRPALDADAARLALAWLIREPRNVLGVLEDLEPARWPTRDSREMAYAMHSLALAGRQVTVFAVVDELRQRARLSETLTPQAINELHREGVLEEEGRAYLATVRAAADLREVRSALDNLLRRAELAKPRPKEVQSLREAAGEAMLRLANAGGQKARGIQTLTEAGRRHIAQLVEAREEGRRPAYSSGFTSVDDMLRGGFRPGQLVVVGGRPGMGKSAIALDFIQRPAARLGIQPVVLMQSLEMISEEVASRVFSRELGEQHGRMLIEGATAQDAEVLNRILDEAAPSMDGVRIMDDPKAGIPALEAQARALKMQTGRLDLVIVDYLQLVRSNKRIDNRVQEVSGITRDLKNLAQSLRVPVIALSQLSRAVEMRPDKRPNLSDLRESGTIEQDADIVLLMYRPGYYGLKADQDEAYAICAKHRNGRTGDIRLRWIGETMSFDDPKLHTENLNATMIRNGVYSEED